MSMDTNVEIKVVKRIENPEEANDFLRDLEKPDSNCTQGMTSLICESHRETRKYVVLDCSADMARDIIVSHVRDVNMGRRNFHFLLTSLVSNEGRRSLRSVYTTTLITFFHFRPFLKNIRY